MEITLKQLNALRAVAETGQFSRAAERLHLTQPALSAQIASLEAILGVALVERGPRQCRLTEAGEEVLATSHRISTELQNMQDRIHYEGFPKSLALGVIPTIAPYILPKLLGILREKSPHARVSVNENTTENILKALALGELNAAILALPIEDEHFASVEIADDPFLLASANPPMRPIHPQNLIAKEMLLLSEGHCLGDQALSICGLSRPEINSTATSLNTLLGLVQQGFGVTLVPQIAETAIREGFPDLILSQFDKPTPFRTIGLVVRKSSLNQDWVKEFASIIRESFSIAKADFPA